MSIVHLSSPSVGEALRQQVGSHKVIVSMSGGKDSAACSLYLTECGIEHERVFADTGWEHDLTYEYLRGELTRVVGPIHEVRGKFTFPELVRKKGMFPSRTKRFCTTELKVGPLSAFHKAQEEETINVVGIRAEESASRARYPEWEYDETFQATVWRPILRWTVEDVIAIHKRHGLAPNPLYLQGATRVGCWPCLHARKDEIQMLAEKDPKRVDQIRQLEAEVLQSAVERNAAKGTTLEERGHMAPTFFQAAVPDTPGGKRRMWPIDRAIAWSQTGKGGKGKRTLELFATHNDGCARWGMCESVAAPAPDEKETP